MFKGIQKVSLVDYPGYVATTLFTGGCNFNCAWCHNRALVEPEQYDKIPDLDIEDIKSYLTERSGKIQAVCVTGGEPTLHTDTLSDFFEWCHKTGLKVKLDSNGYLPDRLKRLLDEGNVDFVAMDIKNSPEKYAKTVGLDSIDFSRIERSIDIIKNSGLDYQFRTTMVTGLVNEKDIDFMEKRYNISIVRQEYVAVPMAETST